MNIQKPIQSEARKSLKYGISAVVLMAVTSTTALAQDSNSSVFGDEIIVTAKKTEQALYEAPVAVSAFSASDLEKRNTVDLIDIGKSVPNLTVTTYGAGNPSSVFPFIRGIGQQDHLIVTDPGVGVYVDGVYLGRQIGQNLSLSNIERIEVLRGPQGTLFGRNSIGGAINIITEAPDDDAFKVSLQAGTRDRLAADVYGTTRLSDTFAVSANLAYSSRDGVGDFINVTDPEARVGELNNVSGRITALWEPTEQFSLTLAADATEGRNGQNPFTTEILNPDGVGGITNADQSTDPFDHATGQADLVRATNEAYGFSATAEYDFANDITAKFIASYRESEYEGGLDDDGAEQDTFSFPETGFADQFSAEFQLSGATNGFDWIAGLYYFTEEGANTQNNFTFFGPAPSASDTGEPPFEQTQETESFAGFVNVGYDVTEDFRITGGLRYTDDQKDATAQIFFQNGGQPFEADASFDEITWEATATYALTDSMSTYAAISKGYQAGGFPSRPFGGVGVFVPFDPVTALNYEAGIKGQPTDWLKMGLSVFYTNFDDLPAGVSSIDPNGFNTVTETAEARSFGVEWEGSLYLGEGFFVNTSVGYIDSEFTDVSGEGTIAEGDTPASTPKWTISVAPEYSFDLEKGSVTIAADASYRSSIEGNAVNTPNTFIEGRTLFGFNAAYHSDDDWSFGVYGKNVTDKRYVSTALDLGDFVLRALGNDPSEFGVRFTKSFN